MKVGGKPNLKPDIVQAIREQNINLVRKMLKKDESLLDKRDLIWGYSLLDYAKRTHNRDMIKLIQDSIQARTNRRFTTQPEPPKFVAPKKPRLAEDDVVLLAKEVFQDDDLDNLEEGSETNQENILPQEDPVDTLKTIFPEVPVEVLRTILADFNNNPELATNFLLNDENPIPATPQAQSQIPLNTSTQWPTLPTPAIKPAQPEKASTKQKEQNPVTETSQEYSKPSVQLLKELSALQLQDNNNNCHETEGSVVLVNDTDYYNDQWVDVDEEEGDELVNDLESINTESELLDFENDASFADSDKESSVVLIEPDEWDISSQISEAPNQDDCLEENSHKVETETVTIIEGSKLSFAAALRSNLNGTEANHEKSQTKKTLKLPSSTFVMDRRDKQKDDDNEDPDFLNSKELNRPHGKAQKTRHNGEYRRKIKPKKTFKAF